MSVLSDLTIDPEATTWTAVVVCNVTGGPADSLHWNLPTEWANGATLEIEGIAHRLVAEAKAGRPETTLWTILPASPIWGQAKLVLRSRRPIQTGMAFNYPEIAPLAATGRGSVERYDLAVGNVSGRTMEVVGSPGLQPIERSGFRTDETLSTQDSIDRAYHVTGERWSLRVRIGQSGEELASLQAVATRVTLAQLSCNLGSDGKPGAGLVMTWVPSMVVSSGSGSRPRRRSLGPQSTG